MRKYETAAKRWYEKRNDNASDEERWKRYEMMNSDEWWWYKTHPTQISKAHGLGLKTDRAKKSF